MESADHPEPARRALPDDGSATPTVGLSTSAVFPDSTGSAFQLAAQLGYDGIELSAIDGMSEHLVLDRWRELAPAIKQLATTYGLELLAIEQPSRDATKMAQAMQAAAFCSGAILS